jgi:hypothetical protein
VVNQTGPHCWPPGPDFHCIFFGGVSKRPPYIYTKPGFWWIFSATKSPFCTDVRDGPDVVSSEWLGTPWNHPGVPSHPHGGFVVPLGMAPAGSLPNGLAPPGTTQVCPPTPTGVLLCHWGWPQPGLFRMAWHPWNHPGCLTAVFWSSHVTPLALLDPIWWSTRQGPTAGPPGLIFTAFFLGGSQKDPPISIQNRVFGGFFPPPNPRFAQMSGMAPTWSLPNGLAPPGTTQVCPPTPTGVLLQLSSCPRHGPLAGPSAPLCAPECSPKMLFWGGGSQKEPPIYIQICDFAGIFPPPATFGPGSR